MCASLPPDELRVSRAFSSFTRVDGNLTSSQTLVATAGVFPGVALDATLGTFTPPPATVDLNTFAAEASVTHRVVWSNSLFSETTVHEHSYRTDVLPQGTATMRLLPDTTLGNFFNNQNRHTGTEQIVETVSGTQNTWAGLNLFKVGMDLLHNSYDGDSSQPDGADRTSRRHARSSSRFLGACSRHSRRTRRTSRCSHRIGSSRTPTGIWNSVRESIGTVSSAAST